MLNPRRRRKFRLGFKSTEDQTGHYTGASLNTNHNGSCKIFCPGSKPGPQKSLLREKLAFPLQHLSHEMKKLD